MSLHCAENRTAKPWLGYDDAGEPAVDQHSTYFVRNITRDHHAWQSRLCSTNVFHQSDPVRTSAEMAVADDRANVRMLGQTSYGSGIISSVHDFEFSV